MPKAIIKIGEHEDQVLNVVKGKFKLKNKSDAINFIIGKFEEYLEGGMQPETEGRYLYEKDDPWMLGEEIPDCNFFFSKIWLNCFVREFVYPAGRAYKKTLTIHRGYHLWFCFGEKDSFDVGEHLVKKFLEDPEFTVKVNKQIIVEADKLRKFASTIPETELGQLSKEDLNHFYQKQEKVHTEYYQWCWIPVAVDMFHNNLTNALKEYLAGKGLSEEKVNEDFIILTQPSEKSLIQIEQEGFLGLALEILRDKEQKKLFDELYKAFQEQEAAPFGLATHTKEYEEKLENKVMEIQNKIDKKIYKKIKEHYQKYFYVKFMWHGKYGVHSFNHYVKELVKFIGRKSDAKALLAGIKEEFIEAAEKKEKVEKEIKMEKKWKTLFDSFGDFMVTKIYRRYAQIFAIYRMQPILKEIAKRLNLSLKQVSFMMAQEVEKGLLQGEVDSGGLQKRTELSVYYNDKDEEKFILGAEAKKFAEMLEKKKIEGVTELKGQTGCPGKAKGVVKIIIRPDDMPKMNQGDILVSIATDPDIVPAMKKAAAFITEQGGVTSHAAIVAREMNTPCVIGTKIATRVLEDGDVVEVDATKGVVKVIEKV